MGAAFREVGWVEGSGWEGVYAKENFWGEGGRMEGAVQALNSEETLCSCCLLVT